MPAAELNAAFRGYGDAGRQWTGGSGTTSVALPDGRVVWLFSAVFLGTVDPDGSRPASSPLISNAMVVQTGTDLAETRHGGSSEAPRALVTPDEPDEFLGVGDAVVESGELRVIYHRYRRGSPRTLDFVRTGVSLAKFALPSLDLGEVTDLPLDSGVIWGSAITPDGAHTYVYGTSSAPGRMKFAHVARAAAGALDGPWEFWTGSAWSSDPGAAGRLLSGVGAGFSVQRVEGEYVLVTLETNLVFDAQLVAYRSPTPTGPFAGPIPLFTAPEATPGTATVVCDAKLHPGQAAPSALLVSYNVNSLEFADIIADSRLCRPRFVDVAWPPPVPAADPPAAPDGLAVTGRDDYADLTWNPVSGAVAYRVHQRDVTGGQTHFARLPLPVTTTGMRASLLIPGHRYEFKVSAVDAGSEGPAGDIGTVTPQSTRTAAEVIGGAGLPDVVADSYIARLRGEGAQRERVRSWSEQIVAQAGGTLDSVFVSVLQGFAATITEAQAINLAAHPDILDVEQDAMVYALDRADQSKAASTSAGVSPKSARS